MNPHLRMPTDELIGELWDWRKAFNDDYIASGFSPTTVDKTFDDAMFKIWDICTEATALEAAVVDLHMEPEKTIWAIMKSFGELSHVPEELEREWSRNPEFEGLTPE